MSHLLIAGGLALSMLSSQSTAQDSALTRDVSVSRYASMVDCAVIAVTVAGITEKNIDRQDHEKLKILSETMLKLVEAETTKLNISSEDRAHYTVQSMKKATAFLKAKTEESRSSANSRFVDQIVSEVAQCTDSVLGVGEAK